MSEYLINSKIVFYCTLIGLVFLVQVQCKIGDKNALTFQWYDEVSAEKVFIHESEKVPVKHLAEYSRVYKKIKSTVLLEATNFTSELADSIALVKSSGFVDTVFYSYQKHHNLIIRPDDIWTAIIIQFSLYVNANAEKLRSSFVNFKEKKELNVAFASPVDRVPIDDFIQQIIDLITDNINPTIYHWISPNFTTTTEHDKLTAEVALMATLQQYFDYGLVLVLCGIPEVTILGDVNDWKDIRQRVEKLKEFELNGSVVMERWSFMLATILDQFIKVKEGKKKDDLFWRQAIRVDYKNIDNGCGSSRETFLNGWITTFSAFDKSGLWQEHPIRPLNIESPWLRISTNKITPGTVHVPINIYDEFAKPDERRYTGAIITGHMGYSVNEDEITIQPLSGWAMTITNNPPEYLRYKSNLKSRSQYTL